MKANTCTSQRAHADGPPPAVELGRLVACVREADRLLAEAVALAGRLAGSGVCEQVEGLPLEQFAGLAARMTGGDARFLVTAGQVLEDLPVTAGLFTAGKLGWGQVRAIVAATRRLTRAERGVVDGRVEATVAAYGPGVDAFDPDGLVWAVDAAVEELEAARAGPERPRERAAGQRGFVSRQMDFDGWMGLYAECDPLTAAVVNNALEAHMRRDPRHDQQPATTGGQPGHTADRQPDTAGPQPDTAGGEQPGGEQPDTAGPQPDTARPGSGWSSKGAGRAAMRALAAVCAQWLGGGPGRPARPLLVAHVDLDQVGLGAAGTLELGLRGPLPRIGAATLEHLARDADLRAVLFDGARPLAVSRKTKLKDIPLRTRRAVQARDRGCRFPGSPDPIAFTDIDHLHQRAGGGDHHPDNLAGISRRFHTLRHDHGWTLTLEPATGMLTAARGKRRWRSLPNGTRLAGAPPPCPACGSHPPPEPRGDPPDPGVRF